ncbi:MAG: extensin family protein [Devosia sp.]
MRNLIQAVFAVLVVTSPVAAQDFFQSFEDFVEEMLPERQAPRIAPREPIDANTPTPVEQRPDDADATVEENGPVAPPPRPRPVVAPEPEPEPEPVAEEDAPERVYQTACPALLEGRVIGEMLDPVAEGICGVRSPLSMTGVRVNGREIGFTAPVTTNCQMAGAIADWVGAVDRYASAALDSSLASVTTGTSLMCRNRNGAADGFVSEHGFANALDVVGFTLENNQSIAVEADWLPAAAPAGRLLRQAHGAACGRFTTVLGPEANAEHEDHLHLDLGCHGQSCTAQICE